MEGPAVKRAKLLTDHKEKWSQWYSNLEILQTRLASGCLCHTSRLELQRPLISSLTSVSKDYTYQFISTISLLCDVALKQQNTGFICSKLSEMASAVSTDESIWEVLLECIDSSEKYTSFITRKCLASFLLFTTLPQVANIFEELFTQVMLGSSNPLKLSNILEVIRTIIEYKDEDDHPLELEVTNSCDSTTNSASKSQSCTKLELDLETLDSEVKPICIKSLENWWTRLFSKFKNLIHNYDSDYEHSIVSFLTLWHTVISVKSNLSVVDTKLFYLQVETFVGLLTPSLPSVIWKKIIDIFNEILCYGSTLSLQDSPPEETCNLAHLVIRCVKSRQFLQGLPYTKGIFSNFGGTSLGSVDWEWESDKTQRRTTSLVSEGDHSNRLGLYTDSSFIGLPSASSSKTIGAGEASSAAYYRSTSLPQSSLADPSILKVNLQTNRNESSCSTNAASNSTSILRPETRNVITSTVFIGPLANVINLDDLSLNDSETCNGDKPLLTKFVLLILKCVAVTVMETRDESDGSDAGSSSSDDEDSSHSASESETNDMIIIEKSIRDVLQQLDHFVKTLVPFHPSAPLGEWVVKLFSDQDDALIEGMLCTLDTFTCFLGRIQIPKDLCQTLNPVLTFITFTSSISEDKDTLLDLLMSNETCFLLYLLRFLKFSWKNWPDFVRNCGCNLEKTMSLLIRLRIALGRLVEKSLFPYNINPVLRLLEKCEEMYESSGTGNANSSNADYST